GQPELTSALKSDGSPPMSTAMDSTAPTEITAVVREIDDSTRFMTMVANHALFAQGTGGGRIAVEGVNVHDVSLRDAILKSARIVRGVFIDCDFTCAVLEGAELENCDFDKSGFAGADFTGAIIADSRFSVAWLANACFAESRLRAAMFPEAQMERVRLHDAIAMGCSFRGADLSEAMFHHAH